MKKILCAIFLVLLSTAAKSEAKELLGGNLDYTLNVSAEKVYLNIKNVNTNISTQITGVSIVLPTTDGTDSKKITLNVTDTSYLNPSIKIEVGTLIDLAKLIEPNMDLNSHKLSASESRECSNCTATPFGILIKSRYSNGLIQESLTGVYLLLLDK